jgi:hypothetical protein
MITAMSRLATLLAVLAIAGSARAQSEDDPKRPWAEGVAQEEQDEALRLFAEGNQTFEQGQYAQALSSYRQAIKHWNHPTIHYNMARALIELDQPLAAYENLLEALRWEGAALEPQLQKEARTYKKLLIGQLAQLQVGVSETGARVLLDGSDLLTGPGQASRVLTPGAHQLVASKAGFLTATRTLSLEAGKLTVETIELTPIQRLTRTERRWRWWKPLTVIAAGVAAVALIGTPLLVDGNSTMQRYDASVASQCPHGCKSSDLPSSVRDLQGRANLETGFAVGMFATGGAVAAAGLIMVIANQSRVQVAPMVLRDGGAIAVGGRF